MSAASSDSEVSFARRTLKCSGATFDSYKDIQQLYPSYIYWLYMLVVYASCMSNLFHSPTEIALSVKHVTRYSHMRSGGGFIHMTGSYSSADASYCPGPHTQALTLMLAGADADTQAVHASPV